MATRGELGSGTTTEQEYPNVIGANLLPYGATTPVTEAARHAAEHAAMGLDYPQWRPWTDYILEQTPTIYFDPSASTSTNAGTLANPYNSVATLASVMTGNKAGTVLGIKRGTTTNLTSTLLFDGLYGTYYAPVTIVPYGDTALDAPIITGAKTLSGWADQGGGIWSRNITTEIGSLPGVAAWDNGSRLWKMASLVNLQAAGTGYYYYDTGSKTLYVKPAIDPSAITLAVVEIALDISYGDVADTGYIVVSGLDIRGACSNSALRIAPKAITTITSASNITVSGVKVGMSGRDESSGTNDGILVNGPSDTVRLSGLVVRGAYVYDCLNNAVEINGAIGPVMEFVESHACCGKMVEFYSSVSSAQVRYNRGLDHTEVKLLTLAVNSCGFWVAAFALTTGVGSGTSSADSTKSLNNAFHHNLFDNIKTNGLLLDAGSGHTVYQNTWACPSTSAASYLRFNSGLTGCVFSNNLVILRAAVPAIWRRTGVTGLTGDGNVYAFQAATTNKFYSDNSTAHTTLAAWIAAASMDTNSRLVALPTVGDVRSAVMPEIRSTGVSGLGYVRDQIGVAHSSPPSPGAMEQ